MAGLKTKRIRLQPRDRQCLEDLDIMQIANRDQFTRMGKFPSLRSANRCLLRLVRGGVLRRIRVASTEPHCYARAEKPLPKTAGQAPALFIPHRLAIGEVYMLLKYGALPANVSLRRWVRFDEPVSKIIALIPDGYWELEHAGGTLSSFLEVDLGTEPLSVWQKKARLYIQLAVSGEFAKTFGHPQFRVLVIADTDRRARNISATIAPITTKIFWLSSFQSIHRTGFWSPVWLRPSADQPVSLI